MNLLKSSKRRAAAVAAAVLLLLGGFLVLNHQKVFLGVFSDDSGLAMVREGNRKEIKKDKNRKAELRVAVTDALGMTNPAYASSDSDQMISSLIFEGLMRQDANGIYETVLAKSVEMAEDGSQCTIELKPKLQFSDGSVVTADDVAFSIAAMCLTDGGTAYENIEGVQEFKEGAAELPSGIQVESGTKLQVQFAAASPDNLKLALCKIQKRPESMDGGMAVVLPGLSTSGVGTGAYVKQERADGTSIRLEASTCYREKIRDIKAVEFVTYNSYNIAEAIQNGDVDMAYFTGGSGLFDPLYDASRFTIYEKPMDSVQYLAVNRDNLLLRRKEARKAAACAIDRDELMNGVLSRYLVKTDALAWENGSLAGTEHISYDPDQAAKLLTSARAELGTDTKALIRFPILKGSQIQEELAKGIKKDLEKAGFEVELNSLEQAEYLQQVYMLGNYDLLLTSAGGWLNPSSYDALISDSQGLSISSASEAVTQAVRKLDASYSQKAQESAIRELNTVLTQEMPVIPIARQKKFVAVSADLKHYHMTPYDAFFSNTWEIRVD